MTKQIFINLPVKNLEKSADFFRRLDFKINSKFSDENATCMIIDHDIFIMLLLENYFQTITPKAISNANKSTEVIISLSSDSRAEVDEMIEKAMRAGGKQSGKTQEQGTMYSRTFEDLDGHLWEIAFMG